MGGLKIEPSFCSCANGVTFRRTVVAHENKIACQPIYGDQNQVAEAVAAVPNGTLGRTYESAPTGGLHNYIAHGSYKTVGLGWL